MASNMLLRKTKMANIKNIIKPVSHSMRPMFFDVSLRDGLQNYRDVKMSLNDKIDIFHTIMFNYSPNKIEIGSIVSPKVMPIMADSLKLYAYAEKFIKETANYDPDLYIVVPNKKGFEIGVENGVKNFSFLTSVSNNFQKKNVNKSLDETQNELTDVFSFIENESKNNGKEFLTKLYISCINQCPLNGKMDNNLVIHEILKYNKNFPLMNEFCLSDTCGSLGFEDYKYIIDSCIFFGMPSSKISLHLHVNKENIDNVKQILFYSLDNNINRFDVSLLETGGCSLTLPSSKLLPNLSYELFNDLYSKYLMTKK
jgi:hydroxymethylglutaryl-CoA lyase